MTTKQTSLAVQEQASLAKTPMDLLQLAIEREGSIDVIERLARLQMEMMDRDAKLAYTQAFEEFKANVPAIVKDSVILVNGQERGKYSKLDKICNTLIPALLKVGITHRWKTRMTDDGRIMVTCYLRHRLGHEEEGSTLGAMPDTSGSKNPVQACGSSTSYLERYTLVASCGIAIKDQDTDGNPPADMTEKQAADLQDYADALRQCDDLPKLKSVFADAYKFAGNVSAHAKSQMTSVYNECKARMQ